MVTTLATIAQESDAAELAFLAGAIVAAVAAVVLLVARSLPAGLTALALALANLGLLLA